MLLALERLGLAGDVLGQGVERRQALFGAAAQLVELDQRPELGLNLLHHRHGGARVLARFARGVADFPVVLRQRGRGRPDLIELALERAGLAHRLLDLGLRRAELRAQLLERRPLFFQRFDRRLCLERLGRELLDGLAMLLQLAVWPDGPLRNLFGLGRGFLQRLNPLVELLDLLGPIVERAEPAADFVEPGHDRRRLVGDLLERLGERGQLRAARRQRREHGADGAALFARGGDEQLELGRLFFDHLALVAGQILERIKHGRLSTPDPRGPRQKNELRMLLSGHDLL